MKEGGLGAPVRHALDWKNPEFWDSEALDEELRRVFDICHGCRRCFNLCDSFPNLFDLIDNATTGELDSVDSAGFKEVVDDCTLCDMCFMTKCPYVPPHEYGIDFPHLMLRARAVYHQQDPEPLAHRLLAHTDTNAALASPLAPVVNWATNKENKLTRPLLEKVIDIDQRATLPKYHATSFVKHATMFPPIVNKDAPAFGRKVVIYATCFVNYHDPDLGNLIQHLLAYNGVETEVVYPACCGMPYLEQANFEQLVKQADKVAPELVSWIDRGYDVVALVPSCALMLKLEWPLIMPDHPTVQKLANGTFDILEYFVDIAKKEGLTPGLSLPTTTITAHIACHARAQNMGKKAAELLSMIPGVETVHVVERCSGHGGTWGLQHENFDTAVKVGKPALTQITRHNGEFVVTECPLAGSHLEDMATLDDKKLYVHHPLEILAKAYNLEIK